MNDKQLDRILFIQGMIGNLVLTLLCCWKISHGQII